MNLERLGSFIRQRRRLLNLTQAELAGQLEITQGYLTKIERGQHIPTPQLILKLAGNLGIKSGQLFQLLEEDSVASTPEEENPFKDLIEDPQLLVELSADGESFKNFSRRTKLSIQALIRIELDERRREKDKGSRD